MNLFKAHGLGNDYLILETRETLDAPLVRALCDRHRGLGGDGILEPIYAEGGSLQGDHGLIIWNPDGSRAEKSGNGLRIFAWWLCAHRAAGRMLSLRVGSARFDAVVEGEMVEIEMGSARFGPPHVPEVRTLTLEDAVLPVCLVDFGNPHCVVFRDESDLDTLPWQRWGEQIERHDVFPNRTNVQFARCDTEGITLRIWERGAGVTLASGSSACAAAVAAVHRGLRRFGRVCVRMSGGDLDVDVREDFSVRLRGPVAPVGRFALDPTWQPERAR